MLRQFLYLDHKLVRDFLAQVEGGVFDESREFTSAEAKRGLSGKVGAGPASAGAERTRNSQSESESVVKQTAASEFDRLYGHLETVGLQVYDTIDEKLDGLPIRRKDIIEVDARLRVSGLQSLADLLGAFGKMAPLMEKFGASVEMEPGAVEGIQALTALGGPDRALPVIATVPGDCGLRIALELRRPFVLGDDWDTEATVVFKVQRILRPGDSQLVGDPFGGLMKLLPEHEREKALMGLQGEEMADLGIAEAEVSYPAIIGTPIAIYR
jgi:hypothetical protein